MGPDTTSLQEDTMIPLAPVALALLALATPQDDPGFKRPAVVQGRFLLPDGSPAAGVALQLHGWQANQERVLEFGLPKAWTDPTAETDAEGRFRMRFVPPRAYQFTLDANREGYAEASWRWVEIALGETKDLEDVTLVPAGTLVGRVVDRNGNVLTEGWYVTAETPRSGFTMNGRDATRAMGRIDPETGEFRIEGVPEGEVDVQGSSGGGVQTDQVRVRVVAGIETPVELVYEGPDLDRRITVVCTSRPFHIFRAGSGAITLIGPDGTEQTAPQGERFSQRTAFDDLPDGEYRVEIDDPLFEFWSKDGVRPGERVDARLRGAAGVELEVVDAETGRPIPRYGVRVEFHESNTFPNEFELLPDGSSPGPRASLEGLVPTSMRLVVRAEGRPPQSVLVEDLERGERRAVRVAVARGARVVGRVLDPAGEPLVDARVEWTPGAVPGYAGPGQRWGPDGLMPSVEEVLRTDSQGRFSLAQAAPGQHTLRLRLSPWVTADRTVALPLAEGDELVLQAPASGWLEGRLLLPEGAAAEGLSLTFHGAGIAADSNPVPSPYLAAAGDEIQGGEVRADGTFRYGPLPVGTLRVRSLMLVRSSARSFRHDTQELGPVAIEAGAVASATWDMRPHFPGSARVRVRVDGEPFVGGGVGFSQNPERVSQRSAELADDGDGFHSIALGPGRWYLFVFGADDTWQWRRPEPFEVAPGDRATVDASLELVRRRVRLVDAESGEPLAEEAVEAWTGARGFMAAHTTARTDAAGELELVLPPGPVRFCRAGEEEPVDSQGFPRRRQEPADSVAAEWAKGPEELVVRVPPKAD